MALLVGEEFTVLANGNVNGAPPLCSLSPGEVHCTLSNQHD